MSDFLGEAHTVAQALRAATELLGPRTDGARFDAEVLMAHALGGTVDYHPLGREVGCHQVVLAAAAKNDDFFADMPEQFGAYLTHEQSVLVPPPGATVLARSDHDAHQILRYGPKALSVQFHPEFTAPLMAACIRRRAELLTSEGRDVAAMLSGIGPTVQSRHLLHAFVALAAS